MNDVLEVVGVEVGKHLGNVSHALPLRCVCKEWSQVATLGCLEATLDLEPRPRDAAAIASAREQLFYKHCPQLRKLTYHVSPWVSLAQFEATMRRLASRLTQLQELVLIFNNPGQQLETRHLAALAALPTLSVLTLQANFHPEACDFGAALGALPHLRAVTVLPSEVSTGLNDAHIASMAALASLESLVFPGHTRAFTGATLASLATPFSRLARLVISSNKPGAVDYSLALPALAGLRALTRRAAAAAQHTTDSDSTSSDSGSGGGLSLEVGVPDAGFAAALMRAVAGPGLDSLSISVREAADSASIAALTAAPGSAQQLTGLDLEFRAAPTEQDVAALAACSSLRRLHLTCKCPRAPAVVLDWTPWLALSNLEHLHLHINPAWRAPLQPAALAAMAAAWPRLSHLHLRLSPSDNATHALQQLSRFRSLKSLSLTWLGQAGPAAGAAGGAAVRGRRSSSLEAAAFNLAHLPPGLQELNLTSISTVRLGLPPPPQQQQQQPVAAVPFAPPPPLLACPAAPPAPVLPALTSLVLDGNFGVSNELLAGLLAHAPQLYSLHLVLAGRQTLSSSGLQAALAASAASSAASGGISQGLGSLSLSDYREAPLCLSQASLAGVAAAGLSRLRHLKLSTPDVVHAELLPSVFAAFTKLRRLDLVGCQDQAVAALGAVLPLCCIKPGPEWLGDSPAAASAAAAAAAAVAAAAAGGNMEVAAAAV